MLAKWWRSSRWAAKVSLSANGDLLGQFAVVVGFPGDDWALLKIKGRRRRGRLPFQARSSPRIIARNFAVTQRPEQVNHRQDVSHGENGGAGDRQDVQNLKFGWISMVAAWHAGPAENELREEGEIESDKDDQGGQAAPTFGIHAAGNFRPPEVDSRQIGHHHTADHDVVEVGD